MATNFDKSLDEIVRVRQIKRPSASPHFKKQYYQQKDWRKTESGKVVGAGQWKKKKTFHSPLDCRLDMTKFSVALSGLAPSVTKEDLEELFSPIVSGKRPF